MTRTELATASRELWRRYRRGGRPNEGERRVLREAFWEGVLPRDFDYNVSQWVENDFPELP